MMSKIVEVGICMWKTSKIDSNIGGIIRENPAHWNLQLPKYKTDSKKWENLESVLRKNGYRV